MIYRISAFTQHLPLTEELIWTIPGVHAVEVSTIETGVVVIYGEEANLLTRLEELPDLDIQQVEIVEEVNWAEHWKQYWHVTRVSERVTIVPSWEVYDAQQADEVVILLDPGSAFGTGAHDTTRLMLQALDTLALEQPLSHRSVLDVGTGSGILAITAAKLGCHMLTGQDIDSTVIPVVQANSHLNNTPNIHWTDTPVEEMCLTPYDVILANILAPVIIELLPAFKQRLSKDGCLLLSGIINTAESSVREALLSHGLICECVSEAGIWRCLKAVCAP